MKKIDISTKKHPETFALVDDEDYDRINEMGKWTASGHSNSIYARITYQGDSTAMQRVVMNTPKEMVVDHINHDTLDNRKRNLRICTQRENNKNRLINKNNTSGYKGVFYVTRGSGNSYWLAQIISDGKQYCLGYHSTPEEAATAYDIAAIELHGEFACINDIDYTKQEHQPIDEAHYAATHTPKEHYLMGLDVDDFTTAIKGLTYRESEIIKLRYGFSDRFTYTLEEIGRIFKVTKQRASQIEAKATRKLKRFIEKQPDFVL